jgi:hypothetical protein
VEASIRKYEQPSPGSQPLKFATLYSQNTWSQFEKCLWKQNILYWRNPSYNAIRMFFTILSALLLGSIFWNIGSKRYESFMILLVIRKIILSLIKTKATKAVIIIIIITMSLDNRYYTEKQLNK